MNKESSMTAKQNQRSQRERMEAGEPYTADDEELAQASRRAYLLAKKYELSYAKSPAAGHKVLEELLGSVAADVHIKPPLYVDYGKYITIGAGSFANYGLVALDVCSITIGKNVKLGSNVQLLTPTHPLEPALRWQRLEGGKPIVIGDNVWIGSGAMVLAGVTIGENSVIGAGSVVTKDIPPNVLALGNPARIVKSLPE